MRMPDEIRLGLLVSAAAVLLTTGACVDIVGADFQRYVDRQEKQFNVTGKPDVSLTTFDGAIEVRPWDRQEVQVIVEKRASNKESADEIEIHSEQNANRIVIDVKVPRHEGFLHVHHRSAKLIVSVPATSNVMAKSGDGSIDVEGITGQVELRSGDGSIRGRRLDGDVNVHTGDGSIRLESMNGSLRVTHRRRQHRRGRNLHQRSGADGRRQRPDCRGARECVERRLGYQHRRRLGNAGAARGLRRGNRCAHRRRPYSPAGSDADERDGTRGEKHRARPPRRRRQQPACSLRRRLDYVETIGRGRRDYFTSRAPVTKRR